MLLDTVLMLCNYQNENKIVNCTGGLVGGEGGEGRGGDTDR